MIKLLLESIDPKRDYAKAAPRAFLFSNQITEFIFKVTGYFLVLFLITGLILTACSDYALLQAFPVLLTFFLFFYIVINTVGIPVFYVIGKIEKNSVRILISWIAVILVMALTIWIIIASPFVDLLIIYIDKLFPNATKCETGIFTINPIVE